MSTEKAKSDTKVKNEKKEGEEKITLVKMPGFTRFLIGGLAAFWLSTIMNPAFVAIAVLVILIIPVLTVDNIFARQFEKAYKKPEEVVHRTMSKSEYLASRKAVQPETPVMESKIESKLNAAIKAKEKSAGTPKH